MKQILLRAGGLLLAMTLLCGFGYTLLVTGIGRLFFPAQAGGSVIEIDGKTYGSALLGQPFAEDGHLWGRVMNPDVGTFTDENGDPVLYAWPSNLSPASEEYEALVAERVKALQAANPGMGPIPVDLVTCSGSGLDPDISPAAAAYQTPRIAKARGISEDAVRDAIARSTSGRFLGVFGEPRVNVLKVNLILDGIRSGA